MHEPKNYICYLNVIKMSVYIAIILCIVIYLLLYVFARRLKNTSVYLKNVPGPKPIFPFGNTLEFVSGSIVFLEKFLGFLKTYGDTVLIHDGAFSWLVLTTDYEFNELIFNSPLFNEKSSQYQFFEGWLGDGLLTSAGPKWRSHRKVITPSFHFSILQQFISIFDSVGDNLVSKLQKEVGKDSVEISRIISLYALDVICEAAMGVKIDALNKENSKYIQSVKDMCNIFVERSLSFLNPLFYPLSWNYYKERKALKVIHEHVEQVISKRIEEKKLNINSRSEDMWNDNTNKKRLAFLDLLLEAKIDGQPLTIRELRDEVNTFMFEGHDTTSSAITFCLLVLATYPEVQEKVFKEQQDLFGNNPKTATPTYKDLGDMKYLDLVIRETLRLYPSVPAFGRKLATDLEFKGNLYPKGISIMIFPYAFQRDPKYFPDPERFIPERFSNTTGKLPFIYTPFSAGPRNCIGQKFAILEILSAVSKIVRHFELIPAKPEHKIQPVLETILISKNGVKIALKNRI